MRRGWVRRTKVPLEDDLHLVIRVRVVQRRALFEAVQAARDGCVGGGGLSVVGEQVVSKEGR
jgi:hypothetical protein